jgi:Arc/MetJ family transcription regulator
MPKMVRTNVVIDERLIRKVMSLYGLATKREAVDFALHAVLDGGGRANPDPWAGALELDGLWADRPDDEMRAIYDDDRPQHQQAPAS